MQFIDAYTLDQNDNSAYTYEMRRTVPYSCYSKAYPSAAADESNVWQALQAPTARPCFGTGASESYQLDGLTQPAAPMDMSTSDVAQNGSPTTVVVQRCVAQRNGNFYAYESGYCKQIHKIAPLLTEPHAEAFANDELASTRAASQLYPMPSYIQLPAGVMGMAGDDGSCQNSYFYDEDFQVQFDVTLSDRSKTDADTTNSSPNAASSQDLFLRQPVCLDPNGPGADMYSLQCSAGGSGAQSSFCSAVGFAGSVISDFDALKSTPLFPDADQDPPSCPYQLSSSPRRRPCSPFAPGFLGPAADSADDNFTCSSLSNDAFHACQLDTRSTKQNYTLAFANATESLIPLTGDSAERNGEAAGAPHERDGQRAEPPERPACGVTTWRLLQQARALVKTAPPSAAGLAFNPQSQSLCSFAALRPNAPTSPLHAARFSGPLFRGDSTPTRNSATLIEIYQRLKSQAELQAPISPLSDMVCEFASFFPAAAARPAPLGAQGPAAGSSADALGVLRFGAGAAQRGSCNCSCLWSILVDHFPCLRSFLKDSGYHEHPGHASATCPAAATLSPASTFSCSSGNNNTRATRFTPATPPVRPQSLQILPLSASPRCGEAAGNQSAPCDAGQPAPPAAPPASSAQTQTSLLDDLHALFEGPSRLRRRKTCAMYFTSRHLPQLDFLAGTCDSACVVCSGLVSSVLATARGAHAHLSSPAPKSSQTLSESKKRDSGNCSLSADDDEQKGNSAGGAHAVAKVSTGGVAVGTASKPPLAPRKPATPTPEPPSGPGSPGQAWGAADPGEPPLTPNGSSSSSANGSAANRAKKSVSFSDKIAMYSPSPASTPQPSPAVSPKKKAPLSVTAEPPSDASVASATSDRAPSPSSRGNSPGLLPKTSCISKAGTPTNDDPLCSPQPLAKAFLLDDVVRSCERLAAGQYHWPSDAYAAEVAAERALYEELCPRLEALIVDGIICQSHVTHQAWYLAEMSLAGDAILEVPQQILATLQNKWYHSSATPSASECGCMFKLFLMGLLSTSTLDVWLDHLRFQPRLMRLFYTSDSALGMANRQLAEPFQRTLAAVRSLSQQMLHLNWPPQLYKLPQPAASADPPATLLPKPSVASSNGLSGRTPSCTPPAPPLPPSAAGRPSAAAVPAASQRSPSPSPPATSRIPPTPAAIKPAVATLDGSFSRIPSPNCGQVCGLSLGPPKAPLAVDSPSASSHSDPPSAKASPVSSSASPSSSASLEKSVTKIPKFSSKLSGFVSTPLLRNMFGRGSSASGGDAGASGGSRGGAKGASKPPAPRAPQPTPGKPPKPASGKAPASALMRGAPADVPVPPGTPVLHRKKSTPAYAAPEKRSKSIWK